MKKLLIRLASLLAVTLMMPSMPFGIVQSVLSAQTITTRTTLKTAITTTATGTVTVTPNSMTGIVALSAGANPNGIASTSNFCLIDGELGQVVNGTVTATTFNWRRGAAPSQHLANAEIHCGPGGFVWTPNSGGGGVTTGVFFSNPNQTPAGACTRANNGNLPVFKVADGKVFAYDCPNNVTASTGVWNEWQLFPMTSSVNAVTLVGFSGTNTITNYTLLPTDYIVQNTSAGTNNATLTFTLQCNTVPPGKIWIISDAGGGVGTAGVGIAFVGTRDTQSILVGFTSRAFESDGTNCNRIF